MRRLLIVLFLMFGCGVSVADQQREDKIISFSEEDAEMNDAMLHANKSLDTFIERFKNPREGDSNFTLKIMISDEYGVEHFWVANLAPHEAGFEGYIANQAKTVKLVDYGQKVNFGRDVITDWAYDHNGVRQGAFTLKVMLKRMSKEDADYYRSIVGW